MRSFSNAVLFFVILASGFSAGVRESPGKSASRTQTLSYWQSNSDNVGYWESAPSFWFECLSSSLSSFYVNYREAGPYAVTQWSNALGHSFQVIGVGADATIRCTGGSREVLSSITGETFPEGITGQTNYSYVNDGSATYGGVTKYLKKMRSARIFIISDSGLDSDRQKNCVIHEVGHALGWMGHSIVSTDIMYARNTTQTTLSAQEKLHLSQVY